MPTPTLEGALKKLEALGDEEVRAQNRRNGAGDDPFGVKLGDLRKRAAQIQANPALAPAL